METVIPTDGSERIEALILDGSLDPLTGKSDILISIRRKSDGYWYDFDDDTFKASGWTTRQQAMTETDSTNDPGVYHYVFDTSVITNATADDVYMIRVDQSPGTDAANLPQTGELKTGIHIDQIQLINDVEGGKWKRDGTQMIFYKADNTTEVMRFNLKDYDGNPAGESDVIVAERERV